jgi:hypothetical protein
MSAPIFLTAQPEDTVLLSIIVGIVLSAVAVLFRPSRHRIRLFRGRGTVYVLQDIRFPYLHKVDLTTTSEQKSCGQVEPGIQGRPMRIVFTTTVPFVKSVEHEAHRLLRRCFYPNAGTIELFKGSTAKMIRAVRRAEREVIREAKRQRRWSRENGAVVN